MAETTYERVKRVILGLNFPWATEEMITPDLKPVEHMDLAQGVDFFNKLDEEFAMGLPTRYLVDADTLQEMVVIIDGELEKASVGK